MGYLVGGKGVFEVHGGFVVQEGLVSIECVYLHIERKVCYDRC